MRNGLERVDVQAAVGLIEDGVLWLEHGHLQNLGALFFAAGESLINRARSKRTIHAEQFHLFVKLGVIIGSLEFLAFGQTRLQRGAEKICNGYARNFARVLESQEKTASRSFIRIEFQKIFAIH